MLKKPYHRRTRPKPQTFTFFEWNRIDLAQVALPPYPRPDPSGVLPDSRPDANRLFDGRAAAAVSATVGDPSAVIVTPRRFDDPTALLNAISYKDVVANIYIVNEKCLAAMAHADYFKDAPHAEYLRSFVSKAIQKADPGWCGSFGPDVNDMGQSSLSGDYDFYQMFMLPLVYNFYDELPDAREKLINKLLALGRIRRAGEDDTLTGGGPPDDWYFAGWGGVAGQGLIPIPETENHVLMIATARYLTNQLLYQGNHDPNYDSRRNGCMAQLVGLLRNYLRDDFAEYNAKNYQEETRHALLNLCSYAYDAEVRLGARMVLDYISAHIAVSSNDLRRMVPFRRRDEAINVRQIPASGFMDVSLLDAHGADPMPAQFALLAGNTRAYQNHDLRDWQDGKLQRSWDWAITGNFGQELTLGALSNYRLPPSIHDLFVNDLHRRFFQRIHRVLLEEPGWQRNCDNMEIYAGSPSYLITAGGEPAPYSIPGVTIAGIRAGYDETNKGVAVTTSFMPTGLSAGRSSNSLQQLGDLVGMSSRPISLKAVAQVFGISVPLSFKQVSAAAASRYPNPSSNEARDLIQIGHFSDVFKGAGFLQPGRENYGVAPDFACGFNIHLPAWIFVHNDKDGWSFVNRQSRGVEPAGFFLAIFKQHTTTPHIIGGGGDFIVLEAFDTWLHPDVSFEKFCQHVTRDNPNIQINSGQDAVYTTYYGNRICFVIWNGGEKDSYYRGSKIIDIKYGAGDPADTLVDAGNDQSQFLSGNILKSAGDAKVEIHNPLLRTEAQNSGTQIMLDWSDPSHLVRIAEDGEVEHAGRNTAGQLYEVWVDFDWNGPMEGDFYRPFNQLASAVAAVADGGVIKIAPGSTRVRGPILGGKRMKIVAPIGGVTIGAP